MIFNMSGSVGGTGGLELKIVGETTQPAKATQNTIWVNTDTEITGYTLSATEPESPIEGMAWVSIGNSGAIKVAAPVGGDWITVYPLFAKQCVGGAWVDRFAESYQDGVWVPWITEVIIVDNGVISEEYGFGTDVVGSSDYNSTITQKTGYFLLQTASSYSCVRCTDTPVNLTGVSRIELDVDALTNTTHSSNDLLSGLSLVVLSSNKAPETTAGSAVSLAVAQAQTKTKGRQTLVIDNSNGALTGVYYIGIVLCAYGSSGAGKANVYSLKCVR